MRHLPVTLLLVSLWLGVAGGIAAEDFPYTATVAHLNVTARSGPTYGTYPTERLPKHSQVEVYQHGDGDWVAIRPPEEAFDWLPATAIKRTEKNVGEVVADDATPWIGSNVKRVEEHVSQVTLKEGEAVEILAEKSIERADGSREVWLKISPPAGEFRWVQLKHLSLESPQKLAEQERAEQLAREERYRRENAMDPPGLLARIRAVERKAPPLLPGDNADGEVQPAQFFGRGRIPLLSRNSRGTNPSSKDEESIPDLKIESGQPVVQDEPDEADTEPEVKVDQRGGITARDVAPEQSKPRGVAPPASAGSQNRPIDSSDFKRLLNQIEVDLTIMVAEDSAKWRLRPLRERATALVEDGPSALERGRARLLLDRIAEFEATLPADYEETAGPPAVPSASTKNNALAKVLEFETKYDAVGYLMPVIAAGPGLPPYQLTDKDGNTLQYVSPAPGVNLNRYVKKQVGLYGQRGYAETLKKQHLTAQRVVDLDRHRR